MLCVSTFTNDNDNIIAEKNMLRSIGLLRIYFLSIRILEKLEQQIRYSIWLIPV
jgi:hypothetical protein